MYLNFSWLLTSPEIHRQGTSAASTTTTTKRRKKSTTSRTTKSAKAEMRRKKRSTVYSTWWALGQLTIQWQLVNEDWSNGHWWNDNSLNDNWSNDNDQMTIDQMTIDQMTIDQMTIDLMNIDSMTIDQRDNWSKNKIDPNCPNRRLLSLTFDWSSLTTCNAPQSTGWHGAWWNFSIFKACYALDHC